MEQLNDLITKYQAMKISWHALSAKDRGYFSKYKEDVKALDNLLDGFIEDLKSLKSKPAKSEKTDVWNEIAKLRKDVDRLKVKNIIYR